MKVLKPHIFPDNIIAGVTLRDVENYHPFGFSIFPNQNIEENQLNINRQIYSNYLDIPLDNILMQKQTHSDIVEIKDYDQNYYEADSMIISKSGFSLNISIADCVGILIYDPINNVIASAHSGWKGTYKNIVEKTILTMFFEYGTLAKDLLVFISPAACGENYEVELNVASLFNIGVTKKNETKYLLDNKFIIYNQLIKAGVRQYNIEISHFCTIADDRFHSFRRDKDKSGRMSAFIMIKN